MCDGGKIPGIAAAMTVRGHTGGKSGPSRVRDGDVVVSDGREDEEWDEECVDRREKRESKFDILRFLSPEDQKKPVPIQPSERLWYLQMCLLCDLLERGYICTGLVDHIKYVAEMDELGVYTVDALVKYDAAIRDRAKHFGMSTVIGADTVLTNRFLGAAGTKAIRGHIARSLQDRRNRITGWKKAAMDRRICFRFSAGQVCEGCVYKHCCVHCNSWDHGAVACTTQAKGGGDK